MARRTVAVVAGVVALAIVAWFVADAFFLPEAGVEVDEPMPDDAAGAQALLAGSFSGADRLHQVSGTVTLYDGPEGAFLRFEEYDATDGPDVYLYLTQGDAEDVEASGVRLSVPGGEGGRATLRGNFNVPLAGDADWASYGAVVAWCDRFDVLFGSATLRAT